MKGLGTVLVAILAVWFVVDFDSFQSFFYSFVERVLELVRGMGEFLEEQGGQR